MVICKTTSRNFPSAKITAILFCLTISNSCGYVSTTNYLEHVRTISISSIAIEDADFSYEESTGELYDEILRGSLVERFNRKWRDGNDSQLQLTITDYELKPIDYDAENRPIRAEMTLALSYVFTDRLRNRVIAEDKNHSQIHRFYLVEGRGEEPETLAQAKATIIRELSNELYNLLAEQW